MIGGLSLPSIPSIPSVPSVPSIPSVPNIPSVPSIPGVPSIPSIPSVPSIPSIPGVPSIPAIPAIPAIPGVPAIPGIPGTHTRSHTPSTPANPAAAGQSAIKGYFNQPIPLWAQQYVLSGLFPFGFFQPLFAPVPTFGNIYTIFYATAGNFFNTLGMNGANLLVSGSMAWAFAKFGSNYMCQGAYSAIATMNPGQPWLPYLESFLYHANPWFTFDIVQSFSPYFHEEGYKTPFKTMFLDSNISINQKVKAWNRQQRVAKQLGKDVDPAYPKPLTATLTSSDIGFVPSQKDASGNTVRSTDANGNPAYTFGYMTPILFGLMLPYLYLWYQQFIVLMPASIQAKIEPFINWIITLLGAIFGLIGTFAAGTFLAAPAAFSQLTSLLPSPQVGGAPKKEAAKFPDLNDVIQDAVNSTKPSVPVLEGGGQDTDESIMFLGSLAIASLAGISLALIRSRKVSPTAAE